MIKFFKIKYIFKKENEYNAMNKRKQMIKFKISKLFSLIIFI
jgi:hypothetical protein